MNKIPKSSKNESTHKKATGMNGHVIRRNYGYRPNGNSNEEDSIPPSGASSIKKNNK